MIFLTVGTQYPFERLVRAIDEIVGRTGVDEEVFAQIGDSSYQPQNFEAVSSLEKNVFDKHLKEASSVISHAGIGTITVALDNNKPLLVMPRLKKYGEVVNDHQVAIVKRFEILGHILVAYETEELPTKIKQLKKFVPCRREAQHQELEERIAQFLNDLSKKGRG